MGHTRPPVLSGMPLHPYTALSLRRPPAPSTPTMPAAALASPSSSLSDLQILTAAHPIDIIDNNKPFSPQHFYVRQPHCLQIIQLEEADALPPPPPQAHKAISSSSFASSSYYSSSYYSESAVSGAYSDEDAEDDEEEEEMGSSYCSSDEEEDDEVPGSVQSPETYALRMKRILAWREHFDAASALLVLGALPYFSIPPSYILSYPTLSIIYLSLGLWTNLHIRRNHARSTLKLSQAETRR